MIQVRTVRLLMGLALLAAVFSAAEVPWCLTHGYVYQGLAMMVGDLTALGILAVIQRHL